MMEMTYHKPVLLSESVAGLQIKPASVYVDATFGGGGHSKEILSQLDSHSKLVAFDQDEDAQQNSIDDPRFTLIPQNFKHLKRFLRYYNIDAVDGILADLGVSSHQFDTPKRGFSIRFDGPLDMRMNQQQELSAKDVVNGYDVAELADVFFNYGELRNARTIAQHISQNRINEIETTAHLNALLLDFLPRGNENKVLAKIYQALRMEVNKEVEVLQNFLVQCKDVLKIGGRLSVISYHSIEDRLVKRFIQNGNFDNEPQKDVFGNPERVFKKCGGLQVPSEDEIKNNNRARSAKLRVAERI
jgi:16S rRNA (cytosine1402-N4)-methyltransferase